MYFGGQTFVLILNALSPSFLHMKNTLPLSAGITTPGLIGFVLFIILYFPIIYFVPAWKVQKLLEIQVVVATATLLGIMGWAVHANGGSPGDLVSPAIKLSRAEAGFRVVQGITSVAGTYTGGTDRVSDWTRYGRKRHTSTPAIFTLAVTVILTALVGIISTSALAQRYGMLEWNPLIMLQWIQLNYYTPVCRAGTFFAGLGLLSVTVFVLGHGCGHDDAAVYHAAAWGHYFLHPRCARESVEVFDTGFDVHHRVEQFRCLYGACRGGAGRRFLDRQEDEVECARAVYAAWHLLVQCGCQLARDGGIYDGHVACVAGLHCGSQWTGRYACGYCLEAVLSDKFLLWVCDERGFVLHFQSHFAASGFGCAGRF
jgi:hypothetical protein